MKRVSAPGEVRRALSRLAALTTVLVLGVLGGCRSGAHVGQSSACPSQPLEDARFGVRYLPCQLTKLPVFEIDTAAWRYPGMMFSAEMSGRARIAFVVDTGGHYVLGSARVLSSSHASFSAYTRYQLQRARFSPGHRGRRAVPVELTYDFVYVIPEGTSPREMSAMEIPPYVTLAWMPSDSTPALEIRVVGEDTRPGSLPDAQLRDSLAHSAIRMRARQLGWDNDSVPHSSTARDLLLCVQGDERVLESAADRALAASMNRPHVRVMTMPGCPPTRASMVPLLPGERPHQYPDSATFVEPHRLQVTRVGLRRGGGPQVDLYDEHRIGGLTYRCVRAPGDSSIFTLHCFIEDVIAH